VLTPVHIPYLSGTDCSSCHASTFAAGGFGPTSMSAAKHRLRADGLRYLPRGRAVVLHGCLDAGAAGRPADHTANGGSEATSDCSACHSTTDWTASVLPAGHMRIRGTRPVRCATRRSARRWRAMRRSPRFRAAHRHQRRLRQCHGSRARPTHVLQQQRQSEGGRAHAAHSRIRTVWIAAPATPRITQRAASAHEHDGGDARVRSDDLRHLSRARLDLVSGQLVHPLQNPSEQRHV